MPPEQVTFEFEYLENVACGNCGFDLGWSVHKDGRLLKGAGWRSNGAVWSSSVRKRRRDALGLPLERRLPAHVVVDPVQILLCPQCGERVLLDLRPRSQEELEAAYLRFSWDAEANVLRESMGLRHSTEPKRR
jgi:hypothetical protein